MIPFDVIDKNTNTSLFVLATLSPKVHNSLELELYRSQADSDESTDDFILNSALTDFLKDINEIGLNLSCDIDTLTEDTSQFFDFLHLCSYLLPNSLYGYLKTKPLLRNLVQRLLEGSLNTGETLIQNYLSELGGLDGQPPLVEDLSDFTDKAYGYFSQTEMFTDYLRNLMDLLNHEQMALESHSDDHTLYRDRVRKIIERLDDAIAHVIKLPYALSFADDLYRSKDIIIKDFISPANFTEYSYILNLKASDIPEDLLESYNQKWYHYQVSHPWCGPYFSVRKMDPEDKHVALMYCMAYALQNSEVDYYAFIKKDYPTSLLAHDVAQLYHTGDA